MKIQETKNTLISIIDRVENADIYFSGIINKSEFIAQILFEIIKNQYFNELPMASLRQYAIGSKQKYSGLDSEYEKIKRRHKMALFEQDKLHQSIGLVFPKNDMSNIDTRLKGYHYNPLQARQIQNYGDLEIITTLSKGQMPDSKKISRARFKDIYCQYDIFIRNMRDEAVLSPEKRVINAIDFYDLQNRMKIELTYNLALVMEKYNIHDYPAQQASIFVSGAFGEGIWLQNRFLLHQNKWFPYVFGEKQTEYENTIHLFIALLELKKEVMDYFYSRTKNCAFEVDEAAAFIQNEYNPFSVFTENKDWNNSRIDLARKILKSYWIGSE
jgi:hypothetical protein